MTLTQKQLKLQRILVLCNGINISLIFSHETISVCTNLYEGKKNSKKKFNKTSCSDKHVKTETFPQIYVQVFCLFARIPVLSEFYSAIKFIK